MDRRKDPRLAVPLPIAFSGDEVAGEGLVSSISKKGCTVVSIEKVQPGALLDLRIQLPEDDSPMEVGLAIVRWSRGERWGLEFLIMHPDEQDRLFSFVHPLPMKLQA